MHRRAKDATNAVIKETVISSDIMNNVRAAQEESGEEAVYVSDLFGDDG